MLVNNTRLGSELAKTFGGTPEKETSSVVLMYAALPCKSGRFKINMSLNRRGHGFTCMASTIQDCVMRAYYTQENARIQATGLSLRAGYLSGTAGKEVSIPEMKCLSASERKGSQGMTVSTCMRPWASKAHLRFVIR